jgi:F-type H+-transporting ATPase subunit a
MARGFRLSSELVAGVVVGAVIGWGFDRLLSTSPLGLIVFLLLGFVAGVINVMRSAGVAPDRTLSADGKSRHLNSIAGVAGGPRDAARMKIDPIHQFNIEPLFTIGHIGNQEIAFTNSSLYMFIAVALISLLMIGGPPAAAGARPLQSIAESVLRIRRQHDPKHRRLGRHEVLPAGVLAVHVHLVSNLIGHHPLHLHGFEPHHRHAALALLVFFTVLVYGFYKNGLKFFKLFVPSGIPIYILPLVVFIEVLSFCLRPVSHSVRLFANMLAGHIALKVFAGFVTMLGALGFVGWIGACCRWR